MGREVEDWDGLMRAANRGDTEAYARFLRAVSPTLRRLIAARGQGLGPEMCEDVLQEVLLAIHLKRHTWSGEGPVRPWLYAVARYKVADAFRARGRRVDLPIEDFAEALEAPEQADPTVRGDAERVIAHLDPRSAEIVRSIGLNGESVAQTGARLKMSEGAVRVALHRALTRIAELRERLIE